MIITCPNCKRSARLIPQGCGSANDNEDVVTWSAPDGFRKVVVGWSSNVLNFYCVECAVPANWSGPRAV